MPQCSRHLLALPFALKLMAGLGLWPRRPGLPPFLHLGPGAGGETERIPFVASNVGAAQSFSECQSIGSKGYLGGRGYHSLLRCMPVLAGDWHQYTKHVMWMLVCKIKIPRFLGWDRFPSQELYWQSVIICFQSPHSET